MSVVGESLSHSEEICGTVVSGSIYWAGAQAVAFYLAVLLKLLAHAWIWVAAEIWAATTEMKTMSGSSFEVSDSRPCVSAFTPQCCSECVFSTRSWTDRILWPIVLWWKICWQETAVCFFPVFWVSSFHPPQVLRMFPASLKPSCFRIENHSTVQARKALLDSQGQPQPISPCPLPSCATSLWFWNTPWRWWPSPSPLPGQLCHCTTAVS